MSYVADLATHLTSLGLVGGTTEWPVYTFAQPATMEKDETIPARAVTLYPTAGRPPPGWKGQLYAGLQVRVRAERHGDEAAFAKIREIVAALHEHISNQVIGTSGIRWIERDQSAPFPLGPDAAGHPEFTFNLTVVGIG